MAFDATPQVCFALDFALDATLESCFSVITTLQVCLEDHTIWQLVSKKSSYQFIHG